MYTGEELKERLNKMLYGPDDPNTKPEFGDFIPYGSEAYKEYIKAMQEGRVHDK